MLSVALVQVGSALPLVAAATASCTFFSSTLHWTEWPQMKTALAIWGRHDKTQHYCYSSSSSLSSSMNTYHYLRNPRHQDHLCVTIFRYYSPMPYCCVLSWINIFQFNSIQFNSKCKLYKFEKSLPSKQNKNFMYLIFIIFFQRTKLIRLDLDTAPFVKQSSSMVNIIKIFGYYHFMLTF